MTNADENADRIADLESRVADLEARLEAHLAAGEETPEAGHESETETWYDPALNQRQRAILDGIADELSRGDIVGLGTLRDAVREYSDVSKPKTVKRYVQTIAESAHFEQAGAQAWRFIRIPAYGTEVIEPDAES